MRLTISLLRKGSMPCVFRSGAYYTLADEETDAVLYSGVKPSCWVSGSCECAMAKVRYEMGNAARAHFQDTVFCSKFRSETIQKEPGFNATNP